MTNHSESNDTEQIYTNNESSGCDQNELFKYAQAIVDKLNSGDSEGAMTSIDELVRVREQSLFQELGKLTRCLHDSLRDFQVDNVETEAVNEIYRIADASDRLNYVITETEKSANMTMDKVEETIPISEELKEKASYLKGEWQRLINRELNPDEFRSLYKEVDVFLDFASDKTMSIQSNLSEILLAQDFQDLTGQVIKKVLKLVTEVESNLVTLVKMAAKVESATGVQFTIQETDDDKLKRQEKRDSFDDGPCVNKDERSDVMATQDDVDDLLSSLGF